MKQVVTLGMALAFTACSLNTPDETQDASIGQSTQTSDEGEQGSSSANTRPSNGTTGGSSTGNVTTGNGTTSGRTSGASTSRPGSSSGPNSTTGAELDAGSPSTSEDETETSSDETTGTSASDQTSTQDTSTEVPEHCANGPLSAPVPDCAPEFEETGDYHADCVARINQLRWECQCLPPLERFEDGEACADEHSQYDYEADKAHAGFSDKICEPGGSGQNECPGYGGRFGVIDYCLQQMWDEGPGENFQAHGHYINMTNEDHTAVACGTYTTPDGEIWAVQNFFR